MSCALIYWKLMLSFPDIATFQPAHTACDTICAGEIRRTGFSLSPSYLLSTFALCDGNSIVDKRNNLINASLTFDTWLANWKEIAQWSRFRRSDKQQNINNSGRNFNTFSNWCMCARAFLIADFFYAHKYSPRNKINNLKMAQALCILNRTTHFRFARPDKADWK